VKTKLVAIFLFGVFLGGCTTAGAPQVGENRGPVRCEVNEQWVCTGITGSRLKKETGFCSCSSVSNIQSF